VASLKHSVARARDRLLRRHRRDLEFVIVTTGRTGSQHLVTLLDSHPEIGCFPELFNPKDDTWYRDSGYDNPFEFLHGVRQLVEARVVGCKLTYQDFHHLPMLFELFDDSGLRVISLHRDNLLAQVTSNGFVRATKTYHSTTGPHSIDKVRLDPTSLLDEIYGLYVRDAFLSAAVRCNPLLRLEYLSLNDPAEHIELQRFLGVKEVPLVSEQAKLVARPLADAIDNWDEVCALLEGTPWERFLAGEQSGAQGRAGDVGESA
jgi:hypothetical protein